MEDIKQGAEKLDPPGRHEWCGYADPSNLLLHESCGGAHARPCGGEADGTARLARGTARGAAVKVAGEACTTRPERTGSTRQATPSGRGRGRERHGAFARLRATRSGGAANALEQRWWRAVGKHAQRGAVRTARNAHCRSTGRRRRGRRARCLPRQLPRPLTEASSSSPPLCLCGPQTRGSSSRGQ